MEIRFTRAARRHKIGRAHALFAMLAALLGTSPDGQCWLMPRNREHDDLLLLVADDDRGVELEIIAVLTPEVVLIIHVMPTALRRGAKTRDRRGS